MRAIVCVDNNWGIGKDNNLLYHLPPDMKFFKEKTIGNVVVMGLSTLKSFPNCQPLNDRVNIVLTKKKDFQQDGAMICHSIEELFKILERFNKDTVYVIGGASVYEQLLPYCNTVYVTKIDFEKPADKFFPNLDKDENWVLAKESEVLEYNDIRYKFTTYKNI